MIRDTILRSIWNYLFTVRQQCQHLWVSADTYEIIIDNETATHIHVYHCAHCCEQRICFFDGFLIYLKARNKPMLLLQSSELGPDGKIQWTQNNLSRAEEYDRRESKANESV